ncbi:MAG: hemolysin family protein [Proteobacteria bacterium]|nr:HlyC/CorC family transporter [Desulfocapsa sp.]MBU3944307.1 hemolysin family protein [Pseudomonadota bacterium]MCG2743885.1 hemolysin family protein [Desulfobacteraceae bacterium]MBU3983202.1 hemolysin family protein [Pseudomonadota bacterium]MBU4030397.1 hemolysin family protein [Pseudomonadota bacterium]
MLSTLITAVTLALIISFCCSLFEAILYSISTSQVEMLKKTGHSSATLLSSLRADINKPITAILTMNTIANTVGATVAGASAAAVFGEQSILLFSAFFTMSILIFSEIIPKTIGVSYAVKLAPVIARPLYWMVILFKPIIWLCQMITRLIPQNKERGNISAEELRTIASLSLKSGEIEADQARVINNILELGNKIVRQVMTPRTVTFSLNQDLTVADTIKLESMFSRHSRIPLYHDTPNDVVGIVMRKDILLAAAEQKNTLPLSQLMNPVHFVAETAPLNRVLVDFYERHQHLFVVVDEYGAITGIISMEDILEEIVGREIMDESDKAKTMRELARRQYRSTSMETTTQTDDIKEDKK